MKKYYDVIVRTPPEDPPKDFEISAAQIVANYFETTVIFQRQEILKTPDLLIHNQVWELKSPRGDGKNTIHNNLKNGRKQSYNVILDLRFCKMNEQRALARVRYAYGRSRRHKCRLLVIRKNSNKIIDADELIWYN